MKTIAFRRLSASIFLILVSTLSACTPGPATPSTQSLKPAPADRLTIQRFRTQLAQADEPPAASLQTVALPTGTPAYELTLASGPTGAGIQMPAQGSFQLQVEASTDNSFAVLDADATDGLARIKVPAQVYDIYLQPQAPQVPALCQTSPPAPGTLLEQMDQIVLDKANQLIAAGQGHCVYLPPLNQRQNANCNTTGSGLNCSGPINKNISASSCPEIAVYAGAMNLNNALPTSKLFVATQNNLTLNQSAQGVLVTRGDLNTNLNNASQLNGVFVAGRSNNLNLGGSSRLQGLYTLASGANLSANLNQNATFEGAICQQGNPGNFNFNRNGSSQTIYHPAIVIPWLADLPDLPNRLCAARPNFYTQTQPLDCSAPTATGSLQLTDTLYGIDQSLVPQTSQWYHLPRRAVPVPTDWYSPDGQSQTLTFNNQGQDKISLRWFASTEAVQVPASVKVIPRVDCIEPSSDGTHTAHLSYVNLMSGPVSLPLSDSNQVLPASLPQTQPTVFAPGQSPVYPNAPTMIDFIGPEISWILGPRQVTVQANDLSLQCPDPNTPPDLMITDVLLTETGESIMGPESEVSLQAPANQAPIRLTLQLDYTGDALTETQMRFTYAAGLRHQSHIDDKPEIRVVMDDYILLEALQVSDQQIQVRLDPQGLPELHLEGLHTLSFIYQETMVDVLVRVGAPESTADWKPVIETIRQELSETPDQGWLILTGRNFPVSRQFQQIYVDGQPIPAYQTEVFQDGRTQLWLAIENWQVFSQKPQHSLIYTSPFGALLESF